MTKAELLELFEIDEASGELRWRSHPSRRHQHLIGRAAGYINSRSTRVVLLHRRSYRVDDIVWCMLMDGDLPSHIEREKPAAQSLYDLTLEAV